MLPYVENIFRFDTLAVDSLENGVERLVCIAQMSDDKGVIRTDVKRQNEYTAWRLIPTGERSRETGQLTYFIQNVGTGRYVSGVGTTSLGQARAWQWVFFPAVRDSLFALYPKICHFVEEGDSLMAYPPKDSLYLFQSISLIEFYESKGYDDYVKLLDSLGQTKNVAESYVVGTEAGEIPEALYERLRSSYDQILSLSTDLEDDVYAQAVEHFYRDKRIADSAATDVKNAYYQIEQVRTVLSPNGQADNLAYDRIYSDGGFLRYLTRQQEEQLFTADSLPKSVFHLERRDDGTYTLRCLYDSLYVVPANDHQHIVKMSSLRPEKGFRFEAWRSGLLLMANEVEQGDDRFVFYLTGVGSNGSERVGHYTMRTWRPGGTRFRLRAVAAPTVDSLRLASVQTRRDERFATLKQKANQLLRQTIIYTCDTLRPVITRAEQLDCNALTTNPNYHDLGALIDGQIETRIITQSGTKDSVYSPHAGHNVALPNALHYLQIATEEALPDSVLIKWTLAYQTGPAPIGVRLLRSRDGRAWETFLTLQDDGEQFPTTRRSPHYTSSLIVIGSSYRLLRMEVTDNAGHTIDRNGNPNMVLAEFNLYPVNGIDLRSQGLRPEVEQASHTLKEAVETAEAHELTEADLQALQQAIDGLLCVWADTTRLDSLAVQALLYDASASVGTNIGQTTKQAVTDLHRATTQAMALRPYYRLTRAEVDTAAVRLAQALAAYQAGIVMPDEHESYFLVSASTGQLQSQCLVATGLTADGRLEVLATTAGNEQNARAAWRFIAQAERGVYGLQNLASGLYLGLGLLSDTLVPLRLLPLGASQMALTTVPGNRLFSARLIDGTLAHNDAQNNAAWIFEAVDHERMTDIKYLHPNSAQVVCLPYTTTQLPTSLYASMEWYEPRGVKCDAEGNVVGLALEFTSDETLQPAKPYVLVMGASSESDEEDLAVDMCMDIDHLDLETSPIPNNGLRGTFAPLHMATTGFSYFDRDNTLHFTTDTVEVLIAPQAGYFSLAALPVMGADVSADLVLPVEQGHTTIEALDHNGDGRFNLPDATLLIDRIVSGLSDSLGRYDHNDDGQFSLPDAIRLIEQMAGP